MERLLLEFLARTTLIAMAAGLALFALRIRRAAAQHAAWAGLLFAMLLLPLWMVWGPKASFPVLPAQPAAAVVDITPVVIAGAPTQTPLQSTPAPVQSTPAPQSNRDWSAILLWIYGLVAGAFLLRLAIGTNRARSLANASSPVTVGFFRPRIILPRLANEWTPARLAAVLAHERAHVRRRDPLFQWLALFNRALFWCHPLAWWLERRLAALAEEACDADVIEQGHDPREYSLCLLDMARAVEYAGERVNVVAMAMPGVYLPKRIKSIMNGARAPRVSRMRLACAAAACVIPAALFAAGSLEHSPQILPLWPLPARVVPQPPELLAQAPQAPAPVPPAAKPAPASKLEFDVATVRPAAPLTGRGTPRGGPGTSDPERVNYRYVTIKNLLMTAYGMPVNQVIGPSWIEADHFDVTATVPAGATKEQVNIMLQNLLADRFKLVVHRESREMPAYELTIAKSGSKLKTYVEDPNGPKFEPGKITFDKNGEPLPPPGGLMMTMGQGKRRIVASKQLVGGMPGLVATLQPELGRPVIDKTGLDGYYDYTLEFRLENPPPPGPDSRLRNPIMTLPILSPLWRSNSA